MKWDTPLHNTCRHPDLRAFIPRTAALQSVWTGNYCDSIPLSHGVVRFCGLPFVKRFALSYRTVVCLSVTLVYCGNTVGWIRMPLGLEVGLGPGHIALDGDPAHPSKGHSSPPLFGPCLLWPNGWMDQYATWYGGRPRPRWHCVTDGDPAPPRKGAQQPHFSAHFALTRSPISATAELLYLLLGCGWSF